MRFQVYKNFSFTIVIILLLTTPFLGCQTKNHQHNKGDLIIGVKIYNIDGDMKTLFEEWEKLGINTVFASVSLINDEFRVLARDHDIEIFIIIPLFFDPDTLQVNPDLYAITDSGEKAVEEWVEFVCPSREDYREQKIKYIKSLIHNLQPDGLSLDFVRHFVFWEKVYPNRKPDSIPNTCFDTHCLKKFETDRNILIPDSLIDISGIAEWIKKICLEEWTEWKCNLITSMIRDVTQQAKQINPEIKVNVHAVPWRQIDFGNAIQIIAGQDFSDIAPFVDIISPMTYAHMVKREPDWISSVVEEIATQAECKIVPSVQVSKAYLTKPLTVTEFKQCVIEALKLPSSGIILWSWEQLDKSPEKKEIFRNISK